MEKVLVTIEWQSENVYAAIVEANYPICMIGYGKSPEKAIDDLRYSIKEVREEFGIEVPEMEFELQYTVRTILHMADTHNFAKQAGITPKRKEQYMMMTREPSKATAKQIEDSLHELGNLLQEIRVIA